MDSDEYLYFELKDGGDKVRVDILGKSYTDAADVWDRNWLKAMVSIQAGGFQGNYNAAFMTTDFESFKQELKVIYEKLDGSASFTCLEDYLELRFIGDGIGHFAVDCFAVDNSAIRNKLEFEINIDQTQIPVIVKQLNFITLRYPVTGLKNK